MLKNNIMSSDPIPEFQQLQATGCTAGDITLYNQVERAVECAIATEGPNVGPLGQSVALAAVANQPPISCMVNLVTGPLADCDSEIPSDRRQAAYNAFSQVTGYRPIDLNRAFQNITAQEKQLLNFTALYIFLPMFLLSLIAIWLMVGFGWINWVIGLFLSVVVFIIIYGFSIAYRLHAQNFIATNGGQLERDAEAAQMNFQNSIAYWPQGLFAVACAVTATGGTGWSCNPVLDCPTCPGSGDIAAESKQIVAMCAAAQQEETPIETVVPNKSEPPKPIRRNGMRRRIRGNK